MNQEIGEMVEATAEDDDYYIDFIANGNEGVNYGRLRFWLDGGYDRDQVEDCEYHPDHQWTQIRVGDAHPEHRWPDERITICKGCFVPRCGESEATGCDSPRHHPEDHCAPSGESWPIGGRRGGDQYA